MTGLARIQFPEAPVTDASTVEIYDAMVGQADHSAKWLRFAERGAGVLWSRYCTDPPRTLAAIADDLGCSKERVRQIEAKALRVLRYRGRQESVERLAPAGTRLSLAVFGRTRPETVL